MIRDEKPTCEAERLEQLWSGGFGDAYVERNRKAAERRGGFWRQLLDGMGLASVLEVGCNLGANLRWITEHVPRRQVWGIDINERALGELRKAVPGVNAVWGPARDLPFRDAGFDLVLTMGVLIHQPDSTLPLVMGEIVRCARRYVLCGEYHAAERTVIPYRGAQDALIKRDYGRMYAELFPRLELVRQGFLSRDDGWDDVTWWLFAKKEGARCGGS